MSRRNLKMTIVRLSVGILGLVLVVRTSYGQQSVDKEPTTTTSSFVSDKTSPADPKKANRENDVATTLRSPEIIELTKLRDEVRSLREDIRRLSDLIEKRQAAKRLETADPPTEAPSRVLSQQPSDNARNDDLTAETNGGHNHKAAVSFTDTEIKTPPELSGQRDSDRTLIDARIVRQTIPSVANIYTETNHHSGDRIFSTQKDSIIHGIGSGIVVDERGYIVTSYHVIAGVDSIRVEIEEEPKFKRSYVARKIQFDREHDLAIIKVDCPKPLKVIACGSSADLKLGEKVIAIGNQYGRAGTTISGIIVEFGRDIEANESLTYQNLIQHSAGVNPGGSGGPLINLRGEVIGINIALRANSKRMGFSIPIDDARKVIASMLNIEKLAGTFHGLVLTDTTSGSIRALRVSECRLDSPAATSGILPGDIITKVGTIDVFDTADFERALLNHSVGDNVVIMVKRDDTFDELTLTLAPFTEDRNCATLGIKLQKLPEKELGELSKTKYRGGLRVLEVAPGKQSFAVGIKKGDILVGLDKWELMNFENLDWILHTIEKTTPNASTDMQVKLFCVRDQMTKIVYLRLPTAGASPLGK